MGLTKEHIFPRWLAKVLTAAAVGPDVTSEKTRRTGEGTKQSSWAAADVASFAVRVVCAGCNNGWMNASEARTRPVLEPMIEGKTTQLSPEAQLDLAAWTAMKAYVVEYALGDVVVATQEERRGLMETGRPQGAVPVRLGAVERDGIPNSVTRIVYEVGTKGTQQGFATCTTFGLGCAVLQVCHGLGITINWSAVSRPGADHVPVNPPCPTQVDWPPAVLLTEASLREWERPIPAADPKGISQSGGN
jgi:hypothetical protein